MKGMKSILFSFVALILMGACLITPALAQEKVVKMALKASDIRSLDPHYGTTTIDYACIDPMFNGLVRFKPEDINPEKIEPDLAERWERSKDGLVWTFYLRKGVKFHDGSILTSKDVKATYDKIVFPPQGVISPRSAFYSCIEKVEALDDSTVAFHLKWASVSFLSSLASPWNYIYKAEILAKNIKLIAIDEMRHAEMFADRIEELGGEPTTDLAEKVSNSQEHRDLALRAAREAIILLKNDGGLLPLDKNRFKKILVFSIYDSSILILAFQSINP
jgi:ABC-type transport system substrate-binding protein